MLRKIIGFIAFILTGSFLLINSLNIAKDIISYIIIIAIAGFYFNGLVTHYKDLKE